MQLSSGFRLALAAAISLLGTRTFAQTWTGAALDGGNWNNANNWNPVGVPNSPAAHVVFTDAGAGNVVILAGVQSRSLTFNTAAGAYTITSQANQFLASLQAITVAASNTTAQTINLANIATGSLLFTGSGPAALTITNNTVPSMLPSLVIGPNTVIGTAGSGGITIGGAGHTAISGSFASGAGSVDGGLTKIGPGVLVLSGNGANLGGPISLNGGTLQLNYSSNTALKFAAASALTSAGGDIEFVPHAATAITQNTAGTNLTAGHTFAFRALAGAAVTFGAGGFTRAAGATFDLDGPLTVFTSTGNTNGLLGSGPAFATYSGSRWAREGGGRIEDSHGSLGVPFMPGVNIHIQANTSDSGTTNSLRFDLGSPILTLTALSDLQSGGILVAQGLSSPTITGSTLQAGAGAGELIVHQYSSGTLTINSAIAASAGLTKTGPGLLILGGTLTTSGPINVNRGSLRITTAAAVGDASSINFNDNRIGGSLQQFIVDLGDGNNGTISRPIRLSAHSVASSFANVFSTGGSLNSRVTLSGAISSATGMTTPVRFTGASDHSSGFRLTGPNTFTGAVQLLNGTLGISSNASFGNAANTLVLAVGSATAGGLEFVGDGINLARPVSITTASRVISSGTDVNTISGPVTGLTLIKDGTGTLVLTNPGNAGNRDVRGGTLQVSPGALGTTGNLFLAHGATLSVTGTDTFPNTRTIFLGAVPGPATGTVDVAANQTFTVAALVANNTGSSGTLAKSGSGTLALTNPANSYTGGTVIQQGTITVTSDSLLGPAVVPVTVNPLGTLRYTAGTSTARTFSMFNGSMDVPSGVTLTMNGATVGGGFLRGGGAYNLLGGTSLTGVTTFNSTILNVTGPATSTNFSNNGAITVNSGQTFGMNYATNGAAGRITVNGTANVSDFTSYGQINVPNGGLINNTLSNMVLGGGSTTFVGAVGNPGGKIDLGGQQLHVRGGLLVTNAGSFASGNGVRNGTTVADYGALVKGTGPYQSVITQNGGQYLPGNSPGTSQVGDFFINGGGNLIFQITDAGPSLSFPSAPGIAGSNPGWGLTQVFTSMNFTATPASPYTITMQTQLPPPAAPDTPGLMSSFDPNRAYQWLIFDLQPGAVFNGTFDPNAINFATAAFVNPTLGGTFSLARTGGQIFLTFTPVPEPVCILGAAAAVALGGFGWWRRRAHPSKTQVAASQHI